MVRLSTAFASVLAVAASDVKVSSSFDLKADGPEVSLCNPCTQLSGQALNILLNVILNAGVVGGCDKLCSALPEGKLACELVCDAVGIKAFIDAIEKADLDPIYMCEIVHACQPGPDDAYLEILGVAAAPPVVAHGADIQMAVDLNVVNDTGVGEFFISIDGPGTATPLSQSFLLAKGIPHGEQMLGVTLTLQDGKDDQGFPATFEPGTYEYSFHVCQGSCGSRHPHSIDFGSMTGTFELSSDLPPVTTPRPPSCMEAFDEDECGRAQDFFGEPCQWCDYYFTCQESMVPCAPGAVV
jgi:hypothetical protein